ncbi:GyrI-like domain-containing protein [Alphaproteobacteria bacterium]|nr:GyrI-like domain-containing protein [Alphaproteobacteria bacterium]
MKQQGTSRKEIKLVGFKERTNNVREMDPDTGIILLTIGRYLQSSLSEKQLEWVRPGRFFCVYTDYDSDENGDYTYFVGGEVSSFEGIEEDAAAEGIVTMTIPAQDYTEFTVGPGEMPQSCIEAWQKNWQMTPQELGGKRRYAADFEVYDERAHDSQTAVFDLCIGISS